MAHETVHLAEYAAGLRYDDLPPQVVQRAKDCITDTVAVIVQGSSLPWSRIVVRYAQRIGAGGRVIFSVSAVRRSGTCGRTGQRRARPCIRIRQSDQARCGRASGRHVAAARAGDRAGTRQQRP